MKKRNAAAYLLCSSLALAGCSGSADQLADSVRQITDSLVSSDRQSEQSVSEADQQSSISQSADESQSLYDQTEEHLEILKQLIQSGKTDYD